MNNKVLSHISGHEMTTDRLRTEKTQPSCLVNGCQQTKMSIVISMSRYDGTPVFTFSDQTRNIAFSIIVCFHVMFAFRYFKTQYMQ